MITRSTFHPPFWLRNPHLQTLYPALFKRIPNLKLRHERLELADGDFLDIAHGGPQQGPILVMFHGLEGSLESHYAQPLMQELHKQGIRTVFMHFRNCSTEPNRLARAYHSGETGDIDCLLTLLKQRHPNTPLYAFAVSLGANALLKYLGEKGATTPLQKALAVSVPFVLSGAAERMQIGFSRFYQWLLIRSLKKSMQTKFKTLPCPIKADVIAGTQSFWDFDHQVTAPLHGFKDVHDYYQQSSCRQYLHNIQIPTLIMHAEDDPFMTTKVIPEEQELSPQVTLELSHHGGHVGFVSTNGFGLPHYWLHTRAVQFFTKA